MSENPSVFSHEPARATGAEPQAHPSIPEAFRWATMDAPDLWQRVALAAAITGADAAFLESPMLFCGPSGCGKTSLACALLREWEARHPGRHGVFMPASRLGIARVQHRFGRGEPPQVALARSADLLLLDALGSECDLATNAVPEVIFARHEAGLPTWVTTWMTARAITQRYGEGITRRISEAGRVTVIQWEGLVGAPYEFLSPDRL